MKDDVVSVIIPTYNRAKYIDRAINSVLQQTYKNYEIIVVDDNEPGSECRKKMESIMKKYESYNNIIYLKHKSNMNGAAARNTGINAARGKYITFLDDDDYYLPRRLEILTKILNKNKNYDAVYSGVVVVENKKIKKILKNDLEGNLEYNILCQKSFFGTGSNIFFTAKSLKKINGFNASFKRHQDLEVLVRFFAENFNITKTTELLVVKSEEDRQNVPNIDNLITYRKFYLETFKNNIKKFDAMKIYNINYYNLLVAAIRSKNKENEIKVRAFFKDNYHSKLSLTDNIKLIIEKINLTIPIIEIYRRLRFKLQKKSINSEILSIIRNYGDLLWK